MITQPEKEALKQALEKEKERILGSLKEVGRQDPHDASNWELKFPEMGEGHNASSSMLEESADEVEELDTRIETENALEDRLREINRALEKIRISTYGLCEICGNEIPLERLRANPAARFDIEHAE